MTQFLGVRSLVGSNYVRVDQVIAITTSDPARCTIYLTGGVTVACAEPAKEVLTRLAAATGIDPPAQPASEETN